MGNICINNLFKISDIVNSVINYLQSLNFYNYYYNIVKQASTFEGDIFTNIYTLINTVNNVQHIAIRELLMFYSNIILNTALDVRISTTLEY